MNGRRCGPKARVRTGAGFPVVILPGAGVVVRLASQHRYPPVVAEMTLARALAAAGGTTEKAAPDFDVPAPVDGLVGSVWRYVAETRWRQTTFVDVGSLVRDPHDRSASVAADPPRGGATRRAQSSTSSA